MILSHISILKNKERIKKLQARRQQIMADLKDAKSEGDLRENFAYKQGREELQRVDKELSDCPEIIPGADVVDPLEWTQGDTPKLVRVGTTVLVQVDNGKPEEFLIGGAWDNFPGVVAYTAPLAKTIMTLNAGESRTTYIAGEEKKFTVKGIRNPTEDEIYALYPEI